MFNRHKWTWIIFLFFLLSCGDESSSPSSPSNSPESISSSSVASSSSRENKSSNSVASSSSRENKSSNSVASSSSRENKSSSSVASSSSRENKSSSSVVSSSSQENKSSSSVVSSSSQENKSSSSVIPLVMSIYDSENNTLTDLRDNNVYKTVIIGEQIWMAENLNYKYKDESKSVCYNDSTKYCDSYGRLYVKEIKDTVCPDKWHLPDSLEWQMLFNNTGNQNGSLKADSSWEEWNGKEMQGTNEYGFSVYAAGHKRKIDSKYNGLGLSTLFFVNDKNMVIRIDRYNSEAPLYRPDTDYMAVSVRCLKDPE